jgi:Ca2+-binding RTX toxin-like protein
VVFGLLHGVATAQSIRIVRKDTTWVSGRTHYGDYQIALGVTLTIEAGAIVRDGSLNIAGTLVVGAGQHPMRTLLDNVYISGLDINGATGKISIENSVLLNTEVRSNYSFSTMSINDCYIGHESTINLYGHSDHLIQNNVLDGSSVYIERSSLNSLQSLRVVDNAFVYNGPGSDSSYGSITLRLFYHEGDVLIRGNSFLETNYALVFGFQKDGPIGVARNNWFATTDSLSIQKLILDNRDDLRRGRFAVTPYLLAPSPSAPAVGTANSDTYQGTPSDDQVHSGSGSDSLTGDAGRDLLVGGDGDDLLDGGPDADTLFGGADKDTFRYADWSDSASHAPDLVVGFQSGVDRIDLSHVDIDPLTPGRQGFRWIGGAQFSGSPGELRRRIIPVDALDGDVDGDAMPDFTIRLERINRVSPRDIDF